MEEKRWRNNRNEVCLLELLNSEFNTFAKNDSEKVNLEYEDD